MIQGRAVAGRGCPGRGCANLVEEGVEVERLGEDFHAVLLELRLLEFTR